MKTWMTAVISLGFVVSRSNGFVRPTGNVMRRSMRSYVSVSELPSIEELSTDPFMKQVSHASSLVPLLDDASLEAELSDRVEAMLSHSDGIRGFFVSYLTGEGDTTADSEVVPKPLANAIKKADQEDLVSLACMNVVMPTAMITMHINVTLSASSAKTAERGKRVLSLLRESNPNVGKNCAAIYDASTDGFNSSETDSDLVEYWKRFFDNYGYKEQQLLDISRAISEFR